MIFYIYQEIDEDKDYGSWLLKDFNLIRSFKSVVALWESAISLKI